MRPTPHARPALAGFTLLLALAAGCGGPTRYKVVPVEGKLTFANGKALPAGTQLRLDPVEGGMQIATATSGEDGSFKFTHASGAAGAELGKYTAVLLPPKDNPDAFYKSVPKAYYESGSLFVEVKEGMGPLELKVPAAKR